MKFFDAHSHLYMPQFDADREAILARMREQGVGSITIGVDYESSVKAVELARSHDFLWASVGLHPNDNASEVFDADKYEALAREQKMVAIGECGLDYYRSSGEGQRERFEAQIALAKKLGKALIIHCRDAHDDCPVILQKTGITYAVPVVMHFFTGSGELAQQYLDLGCYLSFPGPVTYGDMYDDSIRVCPLDKLLAETDSPFAAPVPNRGKRNEPLFVADVVKKIAFVKGLPADHVAAQTVLNSQRIFGLAK